MHRHKDARSRTATEKNAGTWLLTTPSDPPVLNNSAVFTLFVLAATENWRVALASVLEPPIKVLRMALRPLF